MEKNLVVVNVGMKFGLAHVEGAKTVAVCVAIADASTTGKIVKPDYEF